MAVLHITAAAYNLQYQMPTVDTDGRIWNFSATEQLDRPAAKYDLYGDTLLSEVVNGHRSWYLMASDSVHFIREESALMEAIPTDMLPSAAFRSDKMAGEQQFESRGVYCKSSDIIEQGIYATEMPRQGFILLADGDTVTADMTVEHRRFVAVISRKDITLSLDSVTATDTLSIFGITRYRWFVDESLYPAAIQIENHEYDTVGRVISEFSAAYTTSSEDLRNRAQSFKRNRSPNISIEYSDGKLNIKTDNDSVVNISIDITDSSGILYMHDEIQVSAGNPTSLNGVPLPHGQYLATVSSPNTEPAKVWFSVR